MDKNAASDRMDRVVAVSRLADGTPDQTSEFVILGPDGEEHRKTGGDREVAADATATTRRRRTSAKETR